MNDEPVIECRRCGTCCHADMIAYAREADIRRWEIEGRFDILSRVRGNDLLWSGDIIVSSGGIRHASCVYLNWDGAAFFCEIYKTRPMVCREYRPGSSALCPLYSSPESKK